ncbi:MULTISPECIES: Crp/Fnr family transcriptional regulator [Neobacillus]|jgi:CRP-like cAMP-binding protein|uniref:Crp/Fnr family transcriptional regulator n=2 Tax=Neobacillus TaxID=2675232 RepID=A0A6B3TWN7_9BACI|nr:MULTISPECIES: Crp/Fnr family transcriptional regulator [Neobacillus]AIM17145.1 transcriptional regulator [Bacillus sp. X1(2014)]MCD4838283.1 Crp/Fnr family transcriptional regulator [Neobacillus sedimentimangrovi]MED3625204.1 Crp/Fnr family transcriptional regulator [Neobacillus thermocopriae]MED3715116.1 Crp/Fnr family transcriptional regulator [Neobacillus thermocopriae]NEX80037.1 Crp/Fnr family transcriptional regulator [Neobacillus thermocopriae]
MCCGNGCSHEALCIMSVPVFQGLNEADLQLLQKVTRSKTYSKGELIFQEGERSDTLFVVNEGVIKLTKMSAGGKEQIVRLLFPGDFFGLFSLLKNETHYVNAEAVKKTVICFINKKDFLSTMESNAHLSYRFLLALNDRLHEADESVGLLSLMEVEQRLAKVLILFHDKLMAKNHSFTLPITKKDLACYIGTTPETVSRKLQSFVSQRLIRVNGPRHIQILELNQLKQIAEMN